MNDRSPLTIALHCTLFSIALSSCQLLTGDTASNAASDHPSAAAMVEQLANGQFDQLGHIQIASDQIAPVSASASRPHQLLVLPVAFADADFERYSDASDGVQRNRDYLQQALFGRDRDGAALPGTLPHYYLQQSSGRYHIDGHVLAPVTLNHSLAEFGRPLRNSDGSWRNDSKPSRLVTAAIAAAYAANPDYDWHQHDIWDPTDYDQDGNRDEPDGYIDHLVVVYAGKAQSSCHGLHKLQQRFTADQDEQIFDTLNAAQLECANRIWPHRSAITENLAGGPTLGETQHTRGGVAVTPQLWLYDYNMQSEYTDVSTFIHEFGHSLGLPDLYASRTNNSTASWELMSATTAPEPQALSSWSRMMLGWLQPCVVRPPQFGGATSGSVTQRVMNAPESGQPNCAATMVVLPPKLRQLELGPLGPQQGRLAAYSGQGNDLQRSLSRRFDLRSTTAQSGPLEMRFDTWFDIEADWDYLYVELKDGDGRYKRLLPSDRFDAVAGSVMPAAQGHEGSGSRPGLTGFSGDLDGDGRVESHPACDPRQPRPTAEQQLNDPRPDPCSVPLWVTARFDLAPWRGEIIELRWHYFTDGAAVNDGALIDNIAIPAIDYYEDFESADALAAEHGWQNNGFSLSGGEHTLPVPHYLLLEYRDPYAVFAGGHNYDANLAKPGLLFYPDGEQPQPAFKALSINYRPGLLVWYYNGEYLWSQNEPAQNGPGNGFLLLLDSTPQEFALPGLETQLQRTVDGWRFYEFDAAQQPLLAERYAATACFLRRADYFASELRDHYRQLCGDRPAPAVEALHYRGRPLLYGFTLINELLPGAARQQYKAASSFYDMQPRAGQPFYRLYDRLLRNRHSADAPFALTPFAEGIQHWQLDDNGAVVTERSQPFAAVSQFDGREPQRYLNPKLPYGSAALPSIPFSFKLLPSTELDPPGSVINVQFQWHPE